jgi:hypothetical protein
LTHPTSDPRLACTHRTAAAITAIGFVAVAGYQVLLALGIGFSGAAWGGTAVTPALRSASALSAVLLVLAALTVLGRVGYWSSRLPATAFRWGAWVVVTVMAISALANFASQAAWERFFLGPSALLLGILCFAVTRAPTVAR